MTRNRDRENLDLPQVKARKRGGMKSQVSGLYVLCTALYNVKEFQA